MMTPTPGMHVGPGLRVLCMTLATALAGCVAAPASPSHGAAADALIADSHDVLRQRLSMCALSYVVAHGQPHADVAYRNVNQTLQFNSRDAALNRFLVQCMQGARPGPESFEGVLQINGGNPT